MTEKKGSSIVPAYKKKLVSELQELLSSNKTILVASIKNLPASQFQEIGKKLRGKAIIKVPKKSLIKRAIEETNDEELKKIEGVLDDSFAVLFSNMDAYELAGELLKNKTPAKAKPGQIAPADIEIPEGPTELIPGPAISELGALGIKIEIKAGKIEIKEPKVVAKEGEVIIQGAADLMAKLDIKPFSVGYVPLSAFDLEKKILYTEIKIDTEGTVDALKEAYSRALPFAVEVGYANDETIKFLLQKAAAQEMAMGKLSPAEEKKEEVAEEAPKEEEKVEGIDEVDTSAKQSEDSSPKESNSQEEAKEEVTEEKSEEAPAEVTEGEKN